MTASNKTELAVAALKNGTVIDHIPSDVLFKVVSLLGIEKMNTHVTIGSNLKSSRMGTKASSRSPTWSFLSPPSTV